MNLVMLKNNQTQVSEQLIRRIYTKAAEKYSPQYRRGLKNNPDLSFLKKH